MAKIAHPIIRYANCDSKITFIANINVGTLAIAAQTIELENEPTYSDRLRPESGLIIMYQYIKKKINCKIT